VIPDERLLLAAFGSGERAKAAWHDWSGASDVSTLGIAERRLLPRIYRNLRAAGIADAEIPPLVKQMARSLWVRTRLLLRDASATAGLLASQQLDVLLIKGAGLVAAGYCDAGERPMSDLDLLVHPEDAPRAATLLEEAGWHASSPVDRESLTYLHAAVFKKPDRSCDLHWWTLWDSRDAAADARFWKGAESVTFEGVSVRIPRPEHLILHAIVHGTRSFDRTVVRWIGDVLDVLRARGSDLDWKLFVEEVEARRVAYPVGDALAYLAESFQAPVPVEVIEGLRGRPVPPRRRRLYSARPGLESNESVAFLRALIEQALSQGRETPLLTRVLWFPRNLQYVLGAATLARLPAAMIRRGMRVVGRILLHGQTADQRSAGKRTSRISSA
jgi:hypothetical protein